MSCEELLRMIGEWIGSVGLSWKEIKEIGSFIGDVCLFFISVYTFKLTVFPKRLKFISFRRSVSSFNGNSVEVTLENRSLCPIVIKSVDLIIDSNKVKIFDGYCIIEGFKTETIKLEPYSSIFSDDGAVKIETCAFPKMSLWVETSRGAQHIKYERISRIASYLKRKKYMKFKQTTVCRNTYNDRIVMPNVKYAISYIDDKGEIQTIFIHNSGFMSEALFGYNSLPIELVSNKKKLRKHFDSEFGKCGITYRLDEVNSWGDESKEE